MTTSASALEGETVVALLTYEQASQQWKSHHRNLHSYISGRRAGEDEEAMISAPQPYSPPLPNSRLCLSASAELGLSLELLAGGVKYSCIGVCTYRHGSWVHMMTMPCVATLSLTRLCVPASFTMPSPVSDSRRAVH